MHLSKIFILTSDSLDEKSFRSTKCSLFLCLGISWIWVATPPVDMGLLPWMESFPMRPESPGTIHSMHGQSQPTKQAWDGRGERITFSPLAGPSRSGCKHAGRVLWAGLYCSRKHRTCSVDKRKTPVQSPAVASPDPHWATPVRNTFGGFELALAPCLA